MKNSTSRYFKNNFSSLKVGSYDSYSHTFPPVQYSVFECPLKRGVLEQLLEQRWLKVLNLAEDSLRVYPLDAMGSAQPKAIAKQQTKVFGSDPPYEPPDFLIL